MEFLQLTMQNSTVITNSFRAWCLAMRPKTLVSAIVPVALGAAYAFSQTSMEQFQKLPVLLCFAFAIIMQIDANFINDYFDCLKGNDKSEERLGPKRACSEGWITLAAMRRAIIICTIIAAITGLPLIIYGGYKLIFAGLACILFCFLYTTKLSYWGLGDLLVILFFGLTPVCLTYYVAVPPTLQAFPLEVILLALACGLVIDTLLIVNNYRDRDNDRKSGKITLIVRVGEWWGARLYLLAGIIGELLLFYVVYAQNKGKIGSMLLILYLLAHFYAYEKMIQLRQGRELNKILNLTARNIFIFGVLSVFALLL